MNDKCPAVMFLHGMSGDPYGSKYHTLCAKFDASKISAPTLGFEKIRWDDLDFAHLLGLAKSVFTCLQSAVAAAQRAYDERPPRVIVASSLGAAVALQLSTNDTPLVLMSPAWKRDSLMKAPGRLLIEFLRSKFGNPLTTTTPVDNGDMQNLEGLAQIPGTDADPIIPKILPVVPRRTVIIHSPSDPIIPFADSELLASRNDLEEGNLIAVGQSHQLNEPEAHRAMVDAVRRLLGTSSRDPARLADVAEPGSSRFDVGERNPGQ